MTMEYITVKNKADVEFTFEIPFEWYKKTWGKTYEPLKSFRPFLDQFKEWTKLEVKA